MRGGGVMEALMYGGRLFEAETPTQLAVELRRAGHYGMAATIERSVVERATTSATAPLPRFNCGDWVVSGAHGVRGAAGVVVTVGWTGVHVDFGDGLATICDARHLTPLDLGDDHHRELREVWQTREKGRAAVARGVADGFAAAIAACGQRVTPRPTAESIVRDACETLAAKMERRGAPTFAEPVELRRAPWVFVDVDGTEYTMPEAEGLAPPNVMDYAPTPPAQTAMLHGRTMLGSATCPRCAGPATLLLTSVTCERSGGCRTIEERIGEPLVAPFTARYRDYYNRKTGRVEQRTASEAGWYATDASDTIAAIHPTREGAIAAWREKAIAAENGK